MHKRSCSTQIFWAKCTGYNMPRPKKYVPEGNVLVSVFVPRSEYLLFEYECKVAGKDTAVEFAKLVVFPKKEAGKK